MNITKVSNLPESLTKFFKQIKQLYIRDSDFQNQLDYIIENGQVIKNSKRLISLKLLYLSSKG